MLTGSVAGADFGTGFIGNLDDTFSYSVSKAAVIRMGTVLANCLGVHKIRVNVVSPGATLTAAAAPFYGEEGGAARKLLIDRQTLLGRISYPDDIASAALFLASDEASNITGVNLYVDGGFMASGGTGTALHDARPLLEQMIPSVGPETQWLKPKGAQGR